MLEQDVKTEANKPDIRVLLLTPHNIHFTNMPIITNIGSPVNFNSNCTTSPDEARGLIPETDLFLY